MKKTRLESIEPPTSVINPRTTAFTADPRAVSGTSAFELGALKGSWLIGAATWPEASTRGSRLGFLRYRQQPVEAWTGGHFTVPNEQKTQQSPLFGLSRRL